MTEALIIFVRHPEKGKVKTRLAAKLGAAAALDIYERLLRHTREIAMGMTVDKFIFYADGIQMNDAWDQPGFFKKAQSAGDLGDRMMNAFEEIFAEGYSKVCIIGSDCAELSTSIVTKGFDALADSDVVIGPATDGGYYLLGMQQFYPQLFESIPWSTANVALQTIDIMHRSGIGVYQLPILSDVDEVEDVPAGWLNGLPKKDDL
jgi:uncharacterized protein